MLGYSTLCTEPYEHFTIICMCICRNLGSILLSLLPSKGPPHTRLGVVGISEMLLRAKIAGAPVVMWVACVPRVSFRVFGFCSRLSLSHCSGTFPSLSERLGLLDETWGLFYAPSILVPALIPPGSILPLPAPLPPLVIAGASQPCDRKGMKVADKERIVSIQTPSQLQFCF